MSEEYYENYGYWEYRHEAWQCSECGEYNPYGIDLDETDFANYCPNCGLPMLVKNKED